MSGPIFPVPSLPDELISDLRRQNPWWEGNPLPPVPAYRRWPYQKLKTRLDEPLAPILALRGPRQIGKTTLQQQLITDLLGRGVAPTRILRVQFDELDALRTLHAKEPILRIVDWFESAVLLRTLNAAAHAREPAYLFLDEVQNLEGWHVQLKSLVDHSAVRTMVTGSSALRIALGRDSLAGRIQSIEVGPLRLVEIAALRGLGDLRPAQYENGWNEWLAPEFWRALDAAARRQAPVLNAAFAAFSARGAFPLAQAGAQASWPELADQLNETVVKRVIEHDLRLGERGRRRDPQLLEQVFRMACRYAGQSPAHARLAQEASATLDADVGPQRIRHYLDFLEQSLLIRAIPALEIHLKKQRAPGRLCLSDHALRAAWLQEVVPLDAEELDAHPHLSDLAGHIAESAAGYYLSSLTGLDVAHLPERGGNPEVDFVLTIGERRVPVEVKYRRTIDPRRDTLGLKAFIEKRQNNAAFGLLVTRDDGVIIEDPRIIALPFTALLTVR